MKHESIHAALDALRYQHPTGVTTCNVCRRCNTNGSRGTGPCVQCIALELVTEWHVPAALVDSLVAANRKAQAAVGELEDMREIVLKAAGG